MDSNINNEYGQYWNGTDQSQYISNLISTSNYLYAANAIPNIFDNNILEPLELNQAITNINNFYLSQFPISLYNYSYVTIPDNINYSDLYNLFLKTIYELQATVNTTNYINNQPSWIITGLKNSFTQLASLPKNIFDTTFPYLFIGGIILAYLLLKDKF